MEYRQLGRSGLKVPVLSLGTGTFGGTNEFFQRWGQTDVAQAKRMIDLCLDSGLSFFDTADVYSDGVSEEILGQGLKGRRQKVLISTKATFAMGEGENDVGSSRYHLVSSGKIAYIGASNFSGWQLMKSLAVSEKYGLARYVVYQGYYSLIGRHYEWELMPLGLDQGVGLMVWSPLGWGRLTGRIRRGEPLTNGRIASGGAEGGPPVDDGYLFAVVDALDLVSKETGKSVVQVALNWLLQRPSVSNIVIGARNEEQLKQNLGVVGWSLTAAQTALLDKASHQTPIYPYWHQIGFAQRNPKPTTW